MKTNSESHKKQALRGIILLLILLVLGFFALFFYQTYMQVPDSYTDLDAQLGVLPGMTKEEVQQRLNAVVSEGMMNVSINPHSVFKDGTAKGTLRIENIEQNHYSYKVSITKDDTGEEIYQSGLIEPGYYIEEAKLDTVLKKGVYPATARFLAYQDENEEPIGAAVVKITITVEN